MTLPFNNGLVWPIAPIVPTDRIIDIYRYFFAGSTLSQRGLTIQVKRRDLKYIYQRINLADEDMSWNYG